MYTLYGISNCDTVKKARRWLEQNGVDYRFHDYRADGLDMNLLHRFNEALGWESLLNKRSTSWRQIDAADKNELDEQRALELMLATPTLIKRPILDGGDSMLLGFDPKDYQRLL